MSPKIELSPDDPINRLFDDIEKISRLYLRLDYLNLPKEKELADDQLIQQALQKLPSSGPIRKKADIMAVQCIGHLLPQIPPSFPALPALLSAYKSALNRAPV